MEGLVTGPIRKRTLSRRGRLLRLVASVLDPRAWIHAIKLVNYYNYTHVAPLRSVTLGPGAAISPNAAFSNPDRISAGRNLYLGARCHLWAGPSEGRIVIGDNVLFGPEVMVTAAGYRFNDGSPVTAQAMDEADVVIGDDLARHPRNRPARRPDRNRRHRGGRRRGAGRNPCLRRGRRRAGEGCRPPPRSGGNLPARGGPGLIPASLRAGARARFPPASPE